MPLSNKHREGTASAHRSLTVKQQEEARVYTLSYVYSATDSSICLMCLILTAILVSRHYLHVTDTDTDA